MNQNEAISNALRRAILAAPITRYAMAKRLGIQQSTLSRFINRQRGLPLELVDRLGELLGLRLVADPAHELPAGGESKPKTEATTNTETAAKTKAGAKARATTKTGAKSSKAARKGR